MSDNPERVLYTFPTKKQILPTFLSFICYIIIQSKKSQDDFTYKNFVSFKTK